MLLEPELEKQSLFVRVTSVVEVGGVGVEGAPLHFLWGAEPFRISRKTLI